MIELQWVAWIIAIGNFIGGVCITVYYKKHDRLNTALNDYIKLVISIEDKALDYWVKNSDSIYDYQLTLELRRLYDLTERLKKIDADFNPPDQDYIAFKKAITFFDDHSRPVDPRSLLAKKIMVTSTTLQKFYNRYL
jgi:hypothetical protein